MYKYISRIVLLFTCCFTQFAIAQSCVLTISKPNPVVCVNEPILFTAANSPSGNAIAFKFEFGDGGTDSSTSAFSTKIYLSPGTYNTKVTVYLSGGGTCVAIGPIITVNPLPICKYVITSDDTLCFRNNLLCIKDESSPGAASAAITKRIFQLSNGKIFTEFAPYPTTICYNNTNDVFGHLYTMKMEITDVNGCVNSLEKKDSVYLAPQTLPPSFRFSGSLRCNNTIATFINTSPLDSTKYRSWRWSFGDGSFNTTQWSNFKHTYTPPGGIPNLYTTDLFGCIDTALKVASDTIKFIIVDPELRLVKPVKQCQFENLFSFYNFSKNYVSKTYTITDENNKEIVTYAEDSMHYFLRCGIYKLSMKVTFPDTNCNVRVDTMLQVYGPVATMRNDTIKPISATQCEAHDTIYIISPNPYLSCHSGNTAMKWFWDFNDAFAPPCTTDTKNNVNVGLNCRYSLDSTDIKHYYSKDGCYAAKLIMKDTILGCESRDSVSFPLKSPDAGWDSTSNPVRKGLYHDQPSRYICPNTTVTFFFNELLPECGYEKIWINFDSACDVNNWVMMDTVNPGPSSAFMYGSVCDSATGWVTVGVIVKNGQDKLGKDCYDTAWYHKMLHVDVLTSIFEFTTRQRIGCGPYVVDFKLRDSVQYNLEYAFWDFDLSSSLIDDTAYQIMNGDSIVKSQTFTYQKGGIYTVYLALKVQHNDVNPPVSCFSSFREDVYLGIAADAGVFSENHCINDTFSLYGFLNYRNSSYPYWNDPAREAANLERVWWDVGDGKGFFYQGIQPTVKYSKPGTYPIRILVQDSLGCKDTFSRFGPSQVPLSITVSQLKALIGSVNGDLVCAPQIISFKDSSGFVDSLGNILTPDPFLIDSTVWDFGDFTPQSFLKFPAHNFSSNGTYTIHLLATATGVGCRDTETVQITLTGPQPEFVIVGDTQGCAPFNVVFDNTTLKKVKQWIWSFGDPNSTQKVDSTGNNFTFTYTTPGVYNIKLYGIDNVFNPSTGNTIPCTSVFPDTVTNIPTRTVYVLPSPQLDLVMTDTICPGQETTFRVTADTIYSGFNWTFGDGGSATVNRPDTTAKHIFAATGIYRIEVIPTVSTSIKCIDTARIDVHVQDVQADFDINDAKSPLYYFTNKSSANATKFVWDFGQESSSENTSILKDPTHNYGPNLGEFKVCLIAISEDDCWDSTCKIILRDTAYVRIPNVFTPDNNDGLNDAFDIDIQGYTTYHLAIYNRWGGKVYESRQDGVGNDGVNWNGKENNEGMTCPSGVYYFTFTYKLITENSAKTVHGTVSLLRDGE
ncbi:MAG: PKD domain-containing protein [Bacteroidia bacterium]|jgi:gliding motility-associated-like protein